MSTISAGKGKYYSINLSIPRPKFLVSRNLRLERKVLPFGGACPGRVTQNVSAQFNVRFQSYKQHGHPQVGDGVEPIDTARNGKQMKYLLGLVFGFLVVASIAKADSVGMNNKKLTYELDVRVVPLGGQPQDATITGEFTFSPKEFIENSQFSGENVGLKSTLQFNPSPEIGGPSVPLVVDWFRSRFACTQFGGCVPSMYLEEPGVGFAYLEFVPDGSFGLPLQPVWHLRGVLGDGESEEFQMGGSIGYGELNGSATLVTHKESENLLAAQYSTSLATPEPSAGLLLLVAVVFGLLLLRRLHP